MKGCMQDIASLVIESGDFRRVPHSAEHCRPVLMALELCTLHEAEADQEHLAGVTAE